MGDDADLIPARMVNEWIYCPRLAILEHVHGEWADSAETEDGRFVHRRVDEERGSWPAPADIEGTEIARSLLLAAPLEGVIARIDLVEAVSFSNLVRPVDYKRGACPDVPEGAHLPERVQVCAQVLVLRENGYVVEEGALWYAESRRRVCIPITSELIDITRRAIRELREASRIAALPPPLIDSPKCDGCSLAPICLPDEIHSVQLSTSHAKGPTERRTHRRLIPAADDASPLHVSTQGAYVRLDAQELRIETKKEKLGTVRLPETSSVSIYGNVQISTQALRAVFERGVPVAYFTRGGFFCGIASGMPQKNVFARLAQYACATDRSRTLAVVRRLIAAKLRNQRTLLRRNLKSRAQKG